MYHGDNSAANCSPRRECLMISKHKKIILLLQYCSAPECSFGANLDPHACNCVNFTKSTCPNDTSEIVDSYGRCSCQAAVHPECDAGYTLNPDACICKIRVPPTCPNGTYLTPRNAQCIGIDEPTCPEGFSKVGCKCIKEVDRQCQNGELAANDCKCKNVYPPRCSGRGCSLNNTNGECTCERDGKHFSIKLILCIVFYTRFRPTSNPVLLLQKVWRPNLLCL